MTAPVGVWPVPAARVPRALPALLAVLAVAACGSAAAPTSGAASATGTDVRGAVTVFAAASLIDAFEELAVRFQADHPDTVVSVNAGGSSSLAQQIVAGAPADVFAAAGPAPMRVVTDAGLAGAPEVLARNRLEIATPPGNPGGVTGLGDFARPELVLALCAPEVPCGAAAGRVLEVASVTPRPDTLEQDVKAVLAKVQLGEVDAGLVYRTDVAAAAGRVTGIPLPEGDEAVTDYPVAVLADAPNPGAAGAFVEYVLGAAGQEVLADAGFELP